MHTAASEPIQGVSPIDTKISSNSSSETPPMVKRPSVEATRDQKYEDDKEKIENEFMLREV